MGSIIIFDFGFLILDLDFSSFIRPSWVL